MKSEADGRAADGFNKITGTIRDMAGRITENPDLKFRPMAGKMVGKLRKKIAQVGYVFAKW